MGFYQPLGECGGVTLPGHSLDSSSEGWKQGAPWHMTSGISALGFSFFLSCLPRNVGWEWRKSDGDEAQGASQLSFPCPLPPKQKARKNLLDAGLSSSQPLQAALREVTPAPGLKYKAGAFKKGWGTRVVDPAATSPSPRPLPSASAFPEERFGEMSLQKSRKAWTSVRKPFQVSS